MVEDVLRKYFPRCRGTFFPLFFQQLCLVSHIYGFRLGVALLGPDLLRNKLWLLYVNSHPRKIPRVPGK